MNPFRDKSRDLSPKAQEVHANSLIDIGQTLLKSCLLLLTSVLITAIVATGINQDSQGGSIMQLINDFPADSKVIVIFLLLLAFLSGFYLWDKGLRKIDELEKHNKSFNQMPDNVLAGKAELGSGQRRLN